MHTYLPDAQDEHLFDLEVLIRAKIKEQKMCLKTLMGDRDFVIDFKDSEPELGAQVERGDDENVENPIREDSFQYTSRVPSKALRCLNI